MDARQHILHTISRERVLVEPPPHGVWSIQFFQDGFSCLMDDGDHLGLLVDDLLQIGVWQDDQDRLWLTEGEGEGERSWRFGEGFDKHELRNASLQLGPTGARKKLQIAAFLHKRVMSHIFWDLLQLYDVAELTVGHGVASVWLYRGIKRWEGILTKLSVPGIVLRSKEITATEATSIPEPKPGESQVRWRVLRFPSADTVALLALLCLWADDRRGTFGLRHEQGRLAVRDILSALCRCLRGEGLDLQISVGDDTILQYPAWPIGTNRVSAKVAPDLLIDVEEFGSRRVRDSLTKNARKKLDSLRLLRFATMPLVDFLIALGGSLLEHWFAQFVAQIGERIDSLYCKATSGTADGEVHGVSLDTSGLDIESGSTAFVTRQMLAYHVASKEAMRGCDTFSIAVDKSRVFGKGVMNCAVALPSNVAFWAAPKAVWEQCRGSLWGQLVGALPSEFPNSSGGPLSFWKSRARLPLGPASPKSEALSERPLVGGLLWAEIMVLRPHDLRWRFFLRQRGAGGGNARHSAFLAGWVVLRQELVFF